MGMNVSGRKPTGELGNHFHASSREWFLLVDWCQQAAPELVSVDWHTKGLDAAGTLALAEALQTEINAHRTENYAQHCASTYGILFSIENVAAFAAFLRESGGFVLGYTDAEGTQSPTLDEETKAWLAIRKEAAKAINPATAIVTWGYGQIHDPYRIEPDLPVEYQEIGRNYFARAPLSDVWVSFHDLPTSVVEELWRRPARSPSPFDDLPSVDRLVAEIMAWELRRARIRGRGGRRYCRQARASRHHHISEHYMGKRSNFERIKRDFYRTPEAAIAPLLPFLRGVRTFDLSVLHFAWCSTTSALASSRGVEGVVQCRGAAQS